MLPVGATWSAFAKTKSLAWWSEQLDFGMHMSKTPSVWTWIPCIFTSPEFPVYVPRISCTFTKTTYPEWKLYRHETFTGQGHTSDCVFKTRRNILLDTLNLEVHFSIVRIHNFRGALTGVSAKTQALQPGRYIGWVQWICIWNQIQYLWDALILKNIL